MHIVVLQPKFSAIIGLQKKKRQLNDSSSPLSEGAKLHVNLTASMQLKRKKPCQIVHGVTLSLLFKKHDYLKTEMLQKVRHVLYQMNADLTRL